MKRLGPFGCAALISFVPLLVGSCIFFLYYYRRVWFALDTDIEIAAFFTILGYVCIAAATIIVLLVNIVRRRMHWMGMLPVIGILIFTFPIVEVYSSLYEEMEKRAYVRIVDDSHDLSLHAIWSFRFQNHVLEEDPDYVFSMRPCTCDEEPVFITLRVSNDSLVTFDLPRLWSYDCLALNITDITKLPRSEAVFEYNNSVGPAQ